MIIALRKFGEMLSSRQAGKEAYSAFLPTLNTVAADEQIIVDFLDVAVFTPSWGDEFLTPLQNAFGDRCFVMHTENPSVSLTIETLEEIHHMVFQEYKKG